MSNLCLQIFDLINQICQLLFLIIEDVSFNQVSNLYLFIYLHIYLYNIFYKIYLIFFLFFKVFYAILFFTLFQQTRKINRNQLWFLLIFFFSIFLFNCLKGTFSLRLVLKYVHLYAIIILQRNILIFISCF